MNFEEASKQFNNILESLDTDNKKLIKEVFEFAKEAHKGEMRKSGDPFIIHPISMSVVSWNKFQDIELMAAALLHDTVEDNKDIDADIIYEKFGDTIGFLVDSLNKRVKGFYKIEKEFEDRTERLLWAGLQDIRVIILKLIDRTNNLETLEELKPNKQVRMAFETQAIFRPLRNIIKLKKNRKSSIKKAEEHLKSFLKEYDIKDEKEFKEYLYGFVFENFNDELYDLVYENSDKIVWEIKDMGLLEELMKNKDFNDSVEIETMKMTQDGDFKAFFIFKKGVVIDKPGKFEASSFKD